MAPREHAAKRPSASYDVRRFGSKRAEERFNESFSRRKLQHERPVHLDDFQDSPVHDWLVGRGWTPLLTATGDACMELVQEFYANIISRPTEDYAFQTHIRGDSLDFDATDVCRVLGIRDPPMQQYPPAPGQVNYHDVAQVLCGRPRPWYDGLIF
ncbi:hypothetical protein U1Q18_014331, partial [Sarracenia purpurea var. burkii]